MYAIKNLKKIKGNEGESFVQGSLHRKNVKVAVWAEDLNSGILKFDFVSIVEEDVFLTFAKSYLATRLDSDGQFHDLSGSPSGIRETALLSLSAEYYEALEVARLCKKSVCYRAWVDGRPEIFSVSGPYTASAVAQIKAERGTELIEICNETLNLPLIDEAVLALNLQNARYKKLCVKAILFTQRKPDGTLVTKQLGQLYSDEAVSNLRALFPELVEIINERYL
jgi:hypothetical protein